jgi:hypothetical protein
MLTESTCVVPPDTVTVTRMEELEALRTLLSFAEPHASTPILACPYTLCVPENRYVSDAL